MSSGKRTTINRQTGGLPDVMPAPRANPAITRLRAQMGAETALRRTGMEPNEMSRVHALSRAATGAYAATRVYHGSHHLGEPNILQQGLVPQGGPGMSDIIGDNTRSQGHVFFTHDKGQGGYYAATSAGILGERRKLQLSRAMKAATFGTPAYDQLEDAYVDAMGNPPRPTIMRAILPPQVQRRAIPDDKGDEGVDRMLPAVIPPSHMLPGHERPDFEPSPQSGAVDVFQQAMRGRMPGVTRSEATAMLSRQRRLSIGGDEQAIEAGRPAAKGHVDRFRYSNQ